MADVLFDIDNTLAMFSEGMCTAVNAQFGTHYTPADLTKYPFKRTLKPKEWDWFRGHMKYTDSFILNLAPNKTAIAAAHVLQRAGHTIVICTDRNNPDTTSGPTKAWLAKWSVPCDRLVMLGDGTKETLAQQYHAAKVPAALFDDDPRKWQFWPSPLTPLFVPQHAYTPIKNAKGVLVFTDWNVPLHVLGAPSLQESDALMEKRARMGDWWAQEQLRKGGAGSGAPAGHAFEGNQYTAGSGGGNNQYTANTGAPTTAAGVSAALAAAQAQVNAKAQAKKQQAAAAAAAKAKAAQQKRLQAQSKQLTNQAHQMQRNLLLAQATAKASPSPTNQAKVKLVQAQAAQLQAQQNLVQAQLNGGDVKAAQAAVDAAANAVNAAQNTVAQTQAKAITQAPAQAKANQAHAAAATAQAHLQTMQQNLARYQQLAQQNPSSAATARVQAQQAVVAQAETAAQSTAAAAQAAQAAIPQ